MNPLARLGMRARSALLAAGAVVVGLAVGGLVLLTLFRWQLLESLDQTLAQAALDRAAQLEQGADPSTLTAQLSEESLVWIGTPDGDVVAVSGYLIPLENPLEAVDRSLDGDDDDDRDDERSDQDEPDDRRREIEDEADEQEDVERRARERQDELEDLQDDLEDERDSGDGDEEGFGYTGLLPPPAVIAPHAALVDHGGPIGDVVVAQSTETQPDTQPDTQTTFQLADGSYGTVSLLVEEQYEFEGGERERKDLRVAAAMANTRNLVVVVGTETDIITGPVGELAALFALALPILALLVVALTWFTTGSALSSVDRIRAEAAAVTGSDLSRRVPVPQARDEVHDLAVTVNDMLARLEDDQRRVRQFTADASHELRSPVANLRSLAETARLTGPEWEILRSKLTAETERLQGLIDNMLFLAARSEASSPPASTAAVNLDDLLFDEASLLSATTGLRIDVSGVSPVIVNGVAPDLQRLVRNLAANASRHTRSVVGLACATEADGRAVLRVWDDGAGIAPADRERVFERFTRLDEARDRDRGGSGLGLSIVGTIAADHGGTVSITDTPPELLAGTPGPGPGALFTVVLGPAL